MANTISNLLIGIGLESDQKSFQNAESSIDGIKSKAIQLGSLVAGAFGANALTFGFSERIDELGKFSDRWGVAANDVAAYDRALQHAGGTQGEFLGTIRNLSKAMAIAPFERAQMLGELSQFGIAGQVNSVLSATDALDGFLRAADQLKGLSGVRREKFIQALGFSESEVRLLDSGRDGILQVVAAEKKMSPVTQRMTETAAAFNDEWQDIKTNLQGFSDNVAEPITSAITDIIAGMNDWIDANRELINSFLKISGGAIADNIELISSALLLFGGAKLIGGVRALAGAMGLLSKSAASAAASTSKISAFGKGGALGIAAFSAILGAKSINDFLSENIEGYDESDAKFTQAMKDLFSGEWMPGDSVSSDVRGNFSPQWDRRTQPAFQPTSSRRDNIKVDVYLDGQPVKAIVDKRIEEQSEQVIQDFQTSNGG